MNTSKIVLFVLQPFILVALGISAYFGGFNDIEFRVEELGGEVLIYENVVGDHCQISAISDSIYHSLVNNKHITHMKSFDTYYYNPQKTVKHLLRSKIGYIVENIDSITLARLAEKHQVKTLPVYKYVVAKFPLRGKLSSPLGTRKIDAALKKYSEEYYLQDNPVMEIYDMTEKVIIYRKRIGNDSVKLTPARADIHPCVACKASILLMQPQR